MRALGLTVEVANNLFAIFHLLRNNSNKFGQIRDGDQQLCGIVTRKKQIIDWLGGAH
ncbi:hypothetical protein FY034_04445 [Trichlorobacter lovleyi]|uniref:hypothetical protein n=1 Tax=Trichlorobacter lovleyi TaxID=313985 RepID=UPI00223F3DCD|nr:hypothetical protein [Trichlorobacter lovleyi]QOX78214.1 hypothetical protein FY034_04445 [Trichlorobacter lovleyi]